MDSETWVVPASQISCDFLTKVALGRPRKQKLNCTFERQRKKNTTNPRCCSLQLGSRTHKENGSFGASIRTLSLSQSLLNESQCLMSRALVKEGVNDFLTLDNDSWTRANDSCQ